MLRDSSFRDNAMWIACLVCLELPVFLQAYASWRAGVLTPAQMAARGVQKGLPFVAHTGMWSDAILFSPLMTTILINHGTEWNLGYWAICLGIGALVSGIMHLSIYAKAPFETPHARFGALTIAGKIHFVYMVFGIAVVVLFYVCTKAL